MNGDRDPRVRRLFEQVVLHIEDDAPRHVLADLWLEAEDPRGEYLAQVLCGRDDRYTRELLRTHRAAWLGPDLDAVLAHTDFARGFPARASVGPNRRAGELVWARASRDVRLGTLRELRVGRGSVTNYERLLFSPQAKNLVTIEVPSTRTLEDLAREAESRRFETVYLRRATGTPTLRTLARAPAFERLRTLWIPAKGDPVRFARDLTRTGLAARLRTIGVHADESQAQAFEPVVEGLGLKFIGRTQRERELYFEPAR